VPEAHNYLQTTCDGADGACGTCGAADGACAPGSSWFPTLRKGREGWGTLPLWDFGHSTAVEPKRRNSILKTSRPRSLRLYGYSRCPNPQFWMNGLRPGDCPGRSILDECIIANALRDCPGAWSSPAFPGCRRLAWL